MTRVLYCSSGARLVQAFALGFAAALVGCLGEPARGYPLYPATNPLPGADEVARLTGYVKSVDGRDISGLGATSFELFPGCHEIVTPSHWGSFASDKASGIVATTGNVTFILPMKAGALYSVKVEAEDVGGPTGRLAIRAYERDVKGQVTRTFRPAAGQWDLDRCTPAGGSGG